MTDIIRNVCWNGVSRVNIRIKTRFRDTDSIGTTTHNSKPYFKKIKNIDELNVQNEHTRTSIESGLKTHERNAQCLQCCANLTSQLGSMETYQATTSAIIRKRSKKRLNMFLFTS